MTSIQDKTTSPKKANIIALQALRMCQSEPKQKCNTADGNNSNNSKMHQERQRKGAPAFELTQTTADIYTNNWLVKQYRQFCSDHNNLLEEISTSTNKAFKGNETLDKLKRQNQFFVGVLIFANLYIQKLSGQHTHEWLCERFECVCRIAKTKLQKDTEASFKISNNSVLNTNEKDVGNSIISASKRTDVHQETEDGSVVKQEARVPRTATDRTPRTSEEVAPNHLGDVSRQTRSEGAGKHRIRINSQCNSSVDRHYKRYGRGQRGRGRGSGSSLRQEYSNIKRACRYNREYTDDNMRRGDSCRREVRQRTRQSHSRNNRGCSHERKDSRTNIHLRTDNETRPTRHRSRSSSDNRAPQSDLRQVIRNKASSNSHQKYKEETRVQSPRHSDIRERRRSRHNSDIKQRAQLSNESVSSNIKKSTVHKRNGHNLSEHTRNIRGEPAMKKNKEIRKRKTKVYDKESTGPIADATTVEGCNGEKHDNKKSSLQRHTDISNDKMSPSYGYESDKAHGTDSFMSTGSSCSNESLSNTNTKLLARCAFTGSNQLTHSDLKENNAISEMSSSDSETNESSSKFNHSESETKMSYSKTNMCKSKTDLSDSESTHDVGQPKEPIENDKAIGTLAPKSSTFDNNLDCDSDQSHVDLAENTREMSSYSEVSCSNSKSHHSCFSGVESHQSYSNPNPSNSETRQSNPNLNLSDSETHISYSKTSHSDSKTNKHDLEPLESETEINHSESNTQNATTATEEKQLNNPKRAKELNVCETVKLPTSSQSINDLDELKDTSASLAQSDTNLKDSISDTAQFMSYLKSPSISSCSATSTISRESDMYIPPVKSLKNKPVYEVTLSNRRSEGFKRRLKNDSPLQSPQKVKHPKSSSPGIRHSQHNVIDRDRNMMQEEEHATTATTHDAVSSVDRNTTQTSQTTTTTTTSGNTFSSVVKTKRQKRKKHGSKCNLQIKQETQAVSFPPVGQTPTTLAQVEADGLPVTFPACAVDQTITTHEADSGIPVKIESTSGLLSGISHLFTKDQTRNLLSELCDIEPLLSPLSSEDEGDNHTNTRLTRTEQSTSKDTNARGKKRISNVSDAQRSHAKNGKPVKTDLEWFRHSREQLTKKKMNNKIVIKKELK